jgi:hypothetical protein
MSIFSIGGGNAAAGYDIDQSLRFGDGYLRRSFSSGTNPDKVTISCWVKPANIGATATTLFYGYSDASNYEKVVWNASGALYWTGKVGGSTSFDCYTSMLFRDPASWYHLVLVYDSAQATGSNRVNFYVNGELQTKSTDTAPAQNLNSFLLSSSCSIGEDQSSTNLFKSYMAECHAIDGQALTPASFGETNSATNQWVPIEVTGMTYGTNGFYQKYSATELANSFTDSSDPTTFTVNSTISSADILIVAGGGGGGSTLNGRSAAGGSGGAGGLLEGTGISLNAGSYTVLVGAGGAGGIGESNPGGFTHGKNGGDSKISNTTWGTATALGGGYATVPDVASPASGGSGGGGGGHWDGDDGSTAGATGTQANSNGLTGYGNNGGDGGQYAGGAGGGAGGAGSNNGGSAGAGRANAFRTGSNVTYATGGAGRGQSAGDGADGSANTGDGGQGGYHAGGGAHDGGDGGSGIIVIRYISGSPLISGGTVTSYTSGSDTYQVHTWLTGDTRVQHTITANGDVANTRTAGYTFESFTSSTSWTVPSGVTSVEYLVVGGGGGGGGAHQGVGSGGSGGGGGSGGYRTGTLSVTPSDSLTVTIGSGGTAGAANTAGGTGGDSVFDSITAKGGGGGGQRGAVGSNAPSGGGSGGGAGGSLNGTDSGGTGSTYGNDGGNNGGYDKSSGGGGGSAAVGSNAPSNSAGGSGGAGTSNTITGASVTYAAGGAGGFQDNHTSGSAGSANTGNGGGGGQGGNNVGGAGGSGIVVVKYLMQKPGSSSIQFDGTGDYLSVADSDDWSFGTGDFTLEAYVRFNDSAGSENLFSQYQGGSNRWYLHADLTNNTLGFYDAGSGMDVEKTVVTWVADTWYHVAMVRYSGTVTYYVDGTAYTITGTSPGGNITNNTANLQIGQYDSGTNLNGYMDEIRISNSARYTGAFTPTTTAFTADSNTKLLIHSDFNGGLGADSSGNKNDFNITNITVSDQVLDTPTNNFATFNPLVRSSSNSNYSEGNLYATDNGSADWEVRLGTIPLPETGKWYWECRVGNGNAYIGILDEGENITVTNPSGGVIWYGDDGRKRIDGTFSSYGAGYGSANVLGVAVDMDASPRTIEFYKDNTSQGSITITGDCATGTVIPYITSIVQSWINFGQDSSFAGSKTAQGNGGDGEDFYYTPPTGYKALNTTTSLTLLLLYLQIILIQCCTQVMVLHLM